jgi:hypothetical protein
MEAQAVTCPNCGAPLTLDAEGRCTHCHMPIRTAADESSLPALVQVILNAMGALREEPPVQRVLDKDGVTGCAEALTPEVTAAGERVRDAGLIVDGFGTDLKAFQPTEIWTFNLAADLIAVMVEADNLSKIKRGSFRDMLRGIDASLGSHWARSTLGNAAPGSTSSARSGMRCRTADSRSSRRTCSGCRLHRDRCFTETRAVRDLGIR